MTNRFVNFVRYFKHFGYFLDCERLGETLHLQIPALQCVIFLWGVHLTPREGDDAETALLLAQTLSRLPNDVSGGHPERSIQAIQVEILLTLWYLNAGLALQARYRLNNAMSLALSNVLHRNTDPMTQPSSSLPTVNNPIRATQRVNAFWTIVVLANVWVFDEVFLPPFRYQAETPPVTTPWSVDNQLVSSLHT